MAETIVGGSCLIQQLRRNALTCSPSEGLEKSALCNKVHHTSYLSPEDERRSHRCMSVILTICTVPCIAECWNPQHPGEKFPITGGSQIGGTLLLIRQLKNIPVCLSPKHLKHFTHTNEISLTTQSDSLFL